MITCRLFRLAVTYPIFGLVVSCASPAYAQAPAAASAAPEAGQTADQQQLRQELDRLRQELELTVALYQDSTIIDWNPSPEFKLRPGVKLLVITTSESLQELSRLNASQKQKVV